MQLSNFFVKNSPLREIGLNRFMYYENTVGRLVSPAVPHIYILFIQDGHGYVNGQKFKAGDVCAYGFNIHPLFAELHNLTFLGIETEFHLFFQLTGLRPSFCQDVLVLEPKDPLTRLLNNQLLYFPVNTWVSQLESYVINQLTYHVKELDTRTERLIFTTNFILGQNLTGLELLSQELDISYRALQRDFSYLLGITPKIFQSIHRVYQAANYIRTTPLNEAAFLAGYSDQAHMNRDFKRFAGITPHQVNLTHKSDSKFYLQEEASSDSRSGFIIPY